MNAMATAKKAMAIEAIAVEATAIEAIAKEAIATDIECYSYSYRSYCIATAIAI